MGISREHRRDRREGVALDIVTGTWADPRGSYYEVTCDGFGESYSCSVRIQRPNGDVFDRQSVIKQFGDWTIVWGQKYVLDEAISNGHKLQWNNLRGGSGFVWQRVKPDSRYSYGSAPRGSAVRTATPRAAGKAQDYDAKNWNSWFGWHNKHRSGWEKWDKTERSENVDDEEEDEVEPQEDIPNETQATTASDSHDSATETAAKGSASEADAHDGLDQPVISTVRWRPKLHPPPPPPRQIHNRLTHSGYWNKEAVASRFSLEVPLDPPKKSHRPGQYVTGCVSYASSVDFKDAPVYDGILERFDKEKNSGIISSQGAVADYKQNVYVHGSVLYSSKVCLKDFICFIVHTNAHGKPQASRPLLRLRANSGYALTGTFSAAPPEDREHIAGTIDCPAVKQLFEWDVQVSHEVGRQLQSGDKVNFNARWIYEDNDGKLEACEIQCENPQPPPGLNVPCAVEPEAPPGLGDVLPPELVEPSEDSLNRAPLDQSYSGADEQRLRDSLELLGASLAQDLDVEQVIHL